MGAEESPAGIRERTEVPFAGPFFRERPPRLGAASWELAATRATRVLHVRYTLRRPGAQWVGSECNALQQNAPGCNATHLADGCQSTGRSNSCVNSKFNL
jgi:hypothetical protein